MAAAAHSRAPEARRTRAARRRTIRVVRHSLSHKPTDRSGAWAEIGAITLEAELTVVWLQELRRAGQSGGYR